MSLTKVISLSLSCIAGIYCYWAVESRPLFHSVSPISSPTRPWSPFIGYIDDDSNYIIWDDYYNYVVIIKPVPGDRLTGCLRPKEADTDNAVLLKGGKNEVMVQCQENTLVMYSGNVSGSIPLKTDIAAEIIEELEEAKAHDKHISAIQRLSDMMTTEERIDLEFLNKEVVYRGVPRLIEIPTNQNNSRSP